MLVMLAHLNVT